MKEQFDLAKSETVSRRNEINDFEDETVSDLKLAEDCDDVRKSEDKMRLP